MDKNIREALVKLCANIESCYPGILAAFEGLNNEQLGGEHDGFTMIEVFGVPDNLHDQMRSFLDDQVYHLFTAYGVYCCFNLWDAMDTRQYFQDEVASLRKKRRTHYGLGQPDLLEIKENSSWGWNTALLQSGNIAPELPRAA